MKDDVFYMKLAIANAKAMKGQTSPNPLVGAVIVQQGEIVGVGAHMKAGEPHAEIHALQMAGEKAKGADMYVTLEPCSHHGKTGPCTEAIIKSGVKRVVIATQDPNPLVAGKGITMLKQTGIEVEEGICKQEADRLNVPFFHFIQSDLPYVILKSAISLDGKIATSHLESKWITGTEARKEVQQLRQEADAVITGVETIIQDDAGLIVKDSMATQPIRVILDSTLRIPLHAKCLTDHMAETIICTSHMHDQKKYEQLVEKGHQVYVTSGEQRTNIHDVLRMLKERSVMSVLVEAGGNVSASFLEASLVNEAVIYMAPLLIGGKHAPTFFEGEGVKKLKEAIRPADIEYSMVGKDIKMMMKFQ
ncbi:MULTISPECIES: bifunctional diaminohydroxyphosphoribosylaminopyrimidine deaminase/5-amino-6-(5-phosphoribosylamino)uracil reductase RibD [unclassified Bacillus (in: firmicutes)]|uniref:bifunctional diaminohydroxyphosphoribosylaminopyrimidine deaminase/5-amino-6-(5-phosphoribosylamino)uracil reductase RibD n=1 Tax=unclassified Bacillus (in: firmicutes) TaxID=185979 RepID=UPI000D02F656|nr:MULTISPECIES: bifunctional diaminohydroxyphosphoribosylaminopyrimidine deaminase/5-amino-6-(5-phosphoribosylamino)uracil reductase RibD [unclassified Bacillus (in: firmicutes)]PRS78781.1 bifunctional diaminohydroxyphosphoribosylaminopyrimidine deaminase/5-amino-6-(5-phosphoribosylamino)uracil reductase RibD [Bacillus sp. CJCL2]PRS82452.1 bifunctional diaminohydroxyphosphoribosylaminopyrimidine deaminase/5-amino-6-(5-phosphoribosylamino)uracil reductase RibD [Bacillus sp. YBWC18]